jgi:hypothetical protein
MSVASISVDVAGIVAAAKVFENAADKAPGVIQRALNRSGEQAKTQVTRALVKQTGLPRKTIVKAIVPEIGALTYSLKVRGGDVRVQFFGAKESGKGVEARPWNQPRIYAGGFMKQGFKARVAFTKPGMAGHVFHRVGKSRLPIAQMRSGLFIPKELLTGASEIAFQTTVAATLPKRLDHELSRLLSGDGST